jgi:hypothetical protein
MVSAKENRQYSNCRFHRKVYKSLDEREIGIGIFLDLSKAFDLVKSKAIPVTGRGGL